MISGFATSIGTKTFSEKFITENYNLESTQTLSKLGSKVRKYRLLELPTKMPFFKSLDPNWQQQRNVIASFQNNSSLAKKTFEGVSKKGLKDPKDKSTHEW